METIALYGGSFDPPHIGHEAVVKALLSLNEIDKVILMPTFLNPFKKEFFAPAYLRFKWLQKIFCEYERVEVSSYEVEQKMSISTLQSVEYLLKSYKKIYLVIGADNLDSLDRWHMSKMLQSKVTFIVAGRDGIEIPKEYLKLNINVDVSSSDLRKKMNKEELSTVVAESIIDYYKDKNER